MRHGNKDWFEWMYAGFPESRHKNPNLTLAEAVNTLQRIPFQKSSEVLLEIQVFFALRTLRCIYLWDQALSAAEIEVFANEGLREVLTEQEYNFFMGESRLVGGKAHSQRQAVRREAAADIYTPGLRSEELFAFVVKNKDCLNYDQVILEADRASCA